MEVELRYAGSSGVGETASGAEVSFAPNLARSEVAFDAELSDPIRFREAMSALYAVVVGDLRVKRDRSAWRAWKERSAAEEVELRATLRDREKQRALEAIATEPVPANLDSDFQRLHRKYWRARVKWAGELARDDPALFRALVPCDPVITVDPEVVFFEAFSKDESSYGVVTVDRDAFRGAQDAKAGTTNVDYSLPLYDHFQTLRTYKPARLRIDPHGFTVKSGGAAAHREEKIDLPSSWLRGFGQIQAASALPGTLLELPRELVYSILATLASRREKAGPRALRFELAAAKPVRVVVEPWGLPLTAHTGRHDGEDATIKVWGRRRLLVLARLLPFAERITVRLLGSGLPSFWTVQIGGMRMTLGLSGWTANDWGRGAALDELGGGFPLEAQTTDRITRTLESARSMSISDLQRDARTSERATLGSLFELAKRGQIAFDEAAAKVRYRSILPSALTDALLGPEPPEIRAGRLLVGKVAFARDEGLGAGKRLVVATVGDTAAEGILDKDGGFEAAKCSCSFFYKNRLRRGPCRHLYALRVGATRAFVTAPEEEGRTSAGSSPDRRTGALPLSEAILEALAEEAGRRRTTLGEVAAQAWRIAEPRIAQAQGTHALMKQLPAARRTPATPKCSVALPGDIAARIRGEAARLGMGEGELFEAAFRIAEKTMRLTSSLIH